MKKSIFMMIAAAAFVSCSTNDVMEPDMNDGSLISLKSVTYTAGAGTRAPFEGAISATNPLTAFVPSSTASGDYSSTNLHTEGTMTFNSAIAATYNLSSLTNAGDASFPTGDKVYLFGTYPSTGWALATPSTADYALTFSGKEDVMAAKEVLVKKSDVSAGTFQTLAFKHLLTKLEVKFKVEASAVSEVGLIKSVSWVGNTGATASLNNVVTFTPATEAVAFAAVTPTAETELPFYSATESGGVKTYNDAVTYENRTYVLTTTSTLQAYAMVAPVTATGLSNEYYLKVVRTGAANPDYIPFGLKKLDGTDFTGSTAGNAFSVVVNFTKDDIKALATVTDWVENGEYVANTPIN